MSFPELRGFLGRDRNVWLLLFISVAAYLLANERLVLRQRAESNPEFSVRLPVPAQVLMSAGDRNLAANLGGFRVLVAETAKMGAEDYAIQAGLQRDISWLNPAHEDNYYIAAAILPWGGQLEAAQYVLKRAIDARPSDWQPSFYFGFHLYHFYKNPAAGAEALLAGVSHAQDPQDQLALQSVAAVWIERGYRLGDAAERVAAMARAAPPGGLRKYLSARATRLNQLELLRAHARKYEEQTGRRLTDLNELVRAGLVGKLPADPLGGGFSVDANGEPVFSSAAREDVR